MSNKDVVFVFFGGLDISFCVFYLQECGYNVYIVFVDIGGVDDEECDFIEKCVVELGVISYVIVNGGLVIWEGFVKLFVWVGEGYQGQYLLLVLDCYLIVDVVLKCVVELGINIIVYGCMGMGNDQVCFDLVVKVLGDYQIIVLICEIQKEYIQICVYEQKYLEVCGFGVCVKQQVYIINENLLGVIMFGGEIDCWEVLGEGVCGWCVLCSEWLEQVLIVILKFVEGEVVELNGKVLLGDQILVQFNKLFVLYGVGCGVYIGDIVIGLKGCIVFEVLGLVLLLVVYCVLEDVVLIKQQNCFKLDVVCKWVELVYEGFYYDLLKIDIEVFLKFLQVKVNGEVVLEIRGGCVDVVVVKLLYLFNIKGVIYVQLVDWGVEEVEGFIKLFGMSLMFYV